MNTEAQKGIRGPVVVTIERPLPWLSIPALPALVAYTALFAASLFLCFRATGGRFAYPLDDTYITMAIAKHFAQHGVWGVGSDAFTSASSTPLYTLLLAALFKLARPLEWVPLAVAFFFGAGAIWLISTMPGRHGMLAGLAAALLCPMAVVAQTGMEHTLHTALTLIFAWRAARAVAEGRRFDWVLLAIAPVLVMTRYEGLFLVAAAALFLLLRRSFLFALTVCLCAWLPVALYGAFSVQKGWHFLPNSLLLKGTPLHGDSLIWYPILLVGHMKNVFLAQPHMILVALILGVFLFATRRLGRYSFPRVLLWMTAITLAAHAALAEFGWVFRYECYLIALAVLAVTVALPVAEGAKRWMEHAFIGASATGLLLHSVFAFSKMPPYVNAVYSQQVQMGRFVAENFPRSSVALNDVGAVSFMSDVHDVDLVGLANRMVFDDKRAKTYTTAAVAQITTQEKVQFAIVYDSWFTGAVHGPFDGPPLPRDWRRIARWKLPRREQLGGDTVSFYAVQAGADPLLRQKLEDFRRTLPSNVTVIEN